MTVETLSTRPQRFSISRKNTSWPEWLTLAAYAALLAFIIPFHEPWADEAQAWQLARSLPLSTLFSTYLRYEGHPGLWHLLLSALIHLHIGYTGMRWLSGAIALLGVALLVFYAPFPRILRLTLPFTFFLAYQYAVVARGYVLVPLLVFAAAAVWRRSPILVALLLGLLANVALHASAISAGLALVYLLERRRENNREPRRSLLIAAAILLALYGFAIWTVWPSHDVYFQEIDEESVFMKILLFAARGIWSLGLGLIEPIFLAVPFWVLVVRHFKHRGQLLYLLPVVTFAMFSMLYLFRWHAGLLIPTLIAIFWITLESKPSKTSIPRREQIATNLFLLLTIAVQIAWTVYAVAFDYRNPYSPDLATARYLAPRVQAGDKIAVTFLRSRMNHTFFAVGLLPYFPNQIYLNMDRAFWWFSKNNLTEARLPATLAQKPAIVIADVEQLGKLTRYDPLRDPSSPKVEMLHQNGYVLTHAFCGEQPLGFTTGAQLCHLIFEHQPEEKTNPGPR